MRYNSLDPIRIIPGIGPKIGESLERMGLTTLGGLMHWFPRRYIDASQVTPITKVRYGVQNVIKAKVIDVEVRRTKGRNLRMLEVTVEDESGELLIRFFNQPYLANKLAQETEHIFIGIPQRFKGMTVMMSPMIEDAARILPVYAQTKGVSSRMLATYIAQVLPHFGIDHRYIPEEIRQGEGLMTAEDALRTIHQPSSMAALEASRLYFAFEEAFRFFMSMAQMKQVSEEEKGITLKPDIEYLKEIIAHLPFELTAGQKRVVWDALQQMETGQLMTRLVNGDVGSGKTVVAALLAAVMARSGYRTAILAPTEILAKQHSISIAKLLEGSGLSIAVWTAAQKDSLEADIIIGTHALLQEGVYIEKLGLVVVDEQHRFGVKQRSLLRKLHEQPPHLLSMTATPIPRTLALVLFADLHVSFLKEKPKDRLPITTQIIQKGGRGELHRRVLSELALGHQVFVLCPLIDEIKKDEEVESDEDLTLFDLEEQKAADKKTVLQEVERIRKEHPEYGVIEAIHGKMKAGEKREIMARMAAGEINVLVSTSVIEVGVDVPNATIMIIEGAEHFGLAQLHQFRGRVGRGAAQSYCFLCPTRPSTRSIERLQVLVEFQSGFDVAERDLDLRGPGDLTGLAQSGLPDFRMANVTDIAFLSHVKEIAEDFAQKYPEMIGRYSVAGYSNEVASLE